MEALSVCEIMVGNIPIDKDDPGFDSIGLSISIKEVHQRLTKYVNDYEQSRALDVITSQEIVGPK